jgi:CHASE3 domain sensor protein
MTWDAEKFARVAFAVTLALIAALALLCCHRTLDLARLDVQLADSYQSLAALQAVLSTLQEAQAAERGYVLTGEERFLQPYYQASTRLPDGLSRLQELAADNPEEQGRVLLLAEQAAAELSI